MTVSRAPTSGLLTINGRSRLTCPTVTGPDPGRPLRRARGRGRVSREAVRRPSLARALAKAIPPLPPSLFGSLPPEGPEIRSHQDCKPEGHGRLRTHVSLGPLRDLTPSADSCVASDLQSLDPIPGPLGRSCASRCLPSRVLARSLPSPPWAAMGSHVLAPPSHTASRGVAFQHKQMQ